MIRVVQRRLTTADRLHAQLAGQARHRWAALLTELDGREHHPTSEFFRDRRRDNRVTVSGRTTLRYGWHEIVQDRCGVALEVATVLRSLGWTGTPRRCGPGCTLGTGPW